MQVRTFIEPLAALTVRPPTRTTSVTAITISCMITIFFPSFGLKCGQRIRRAPEPFSPYSGMLSPRGTPTHSTDVVAFEDDPRLGASPKLRFIHYGIEDT